MTYAKGTSVSVEKSRSEIETIVKRYGATAFSYCVNHYKAMIQFELSDRMVRFVLPIPQLTDPAVAQRVFRGSTEDVPEDDRPRRADQMSHERWRALRICILAKLEAVESGITQFEEEFFAHIVDPTTQKTVYELVSPQITIAYSEQPKPIGLPDPEEYVQEVRHVD